jgi:hypothetical protein
MIKKILLAHSIVELLAGIALVLRPSLLLNNMSQEPSTLAVAKMYGILATIFGFISFQVWKHFSFSTFDKMFVLIVITFHVMIGFHMYVLKDINLTNTIGGAILHLGFAIFMAMGYLQSRENFQ